MEIQAIGPSAVGRSTFFNGGECKNWFIHFNPKQELAKIDSVLLPTSGLKAFSTAGTGPIRAMCEFLGVLYVLSGKSLYSINTAGTATLLGSLTYTRVSRPDLVPGVSTNPVIVVANGNDSYYWDTVALTWTQITDVDFPGAERMDYIQGYWLAVWNGVLYWSALNNIASWVGSDLLTPGYKPDKLKDVMVFQNQVYLFKENSIQVYILSGDSNIFTEQSQSSIHVGIGALPTAEVLNNSIYFLSNSSKGETKVLKMAYGQIQDIGTPEVYDDLVKEEGYASAYALSYSERGHDFYQLTIPDRNITWIYDTTTNLWHKKESYLGVDGSGTPIYGQHLANCVAGFNSRLYAGDFRTNAIYQIDSNTFTDNSNIIVRIAETANINLSNQFFSIGQLLLDWETGMTLDGNESPTIKIEVSKDGGRTYNPAVYRSLGNTGDRTKRVSVNSIGRSRNFKFRFTFTGTGDYKLGKVLVKMNMQSTQYNDFGKEVA